MATQYWITPCNPELYRVVDAYAVNNEIDWRLSANVKLNDIVYIYLSTKDYRYVKFKTMVVELDIHYDDTMDDDEFITEKGLEKLPSPKSFTRLRLVETFPDNLISISKLKENGLHGNIQCTQNLPSKCLEMISSVEQIKEYPYGYFAYLIDEVSKGITTDGSKTAANIRIILPQIISWAKNGKLDGTYKDLMELLGYPKFSGIGKLLGRVHDVFVKLSEMTNVGIPTINALVSSSKAGIPSDGIEYVFKDFATLTDSEKRELTSMFNTKAISWPNWDWVLYILGLKQPADTSVVDKIRTGSFGFGGEGEEHKALKNHIAHNPQILGITTDELGETEHILLSGDRLDVFFPSFNAAIEVKPSTSPEADVMRGIFQCVKYKAVLDAEAKYMGRYVNSKVCLVLGGTLTDATRKAAEDLGVKVYECISIPVINKQQ
mgnify:FL=1